MTDWILIGKKKRINCAFNFLLLRDRIMMLRAEMEHVGKQGSSGVKLMSFSLELLKFGGIAVKSDC